MLGIRTRGRRMVGADKTTELWQPPQTYLLISFNNIFFTSYDVLSMFSQSNSLFNLSIFLHLSLSILIQLFLIFSDSLSLSISFLSFFLSFFHVSFLSLSPLMQPLQYKTEQTSIKRSALEL